MINMWPSRNESDHVLIIAIDVDFGYKRQKRAFSLMVQKPQNARSVIVL
jgi:hypothetical protein